MLTLEDCIALSELTEEEILAIAEHEHIPEMAAAELGSYLVQTTEGETRISVMIRDDIDHAHRVGDFKRAALLRCCLRHFLEHHPQAAVHGLRRHGAD
jgi:hypothetical protein